MSSESSGARSYGEYAGGRGGGESGEGYAPDDDPPLCINMK